MSAPSSIRADRIARAAALLAVAAVACGTSEPAGSGQKAPPVVHVAISVDWEGGFLLPESLAALEAFRRDNPGVPLTHMLNAAYYTKPGAVAADVTREIRRAVRDGDDTGLHIHGWKTLVVAAGVKPLDGPSFLSPSTGLIAFQDDIGFDLDLTAFTVADLRAIMKKSRAILEGQGLAVGPSFRAGGWIATPGVLEAARAEGFTIDSSAIDPAWLDEKEVAALRRRLADVWRRVDQTTQPFWIDTPAGKILEMPDTGAAADYLSVVEIQQHVERAATATVAAGKPVFVHMVLHAETADEYAPRLGQALSVLRARSTPMVFETLSDSAEVARRALEGQGR
jgi:hypothetical protein